MAPWLALNLPNWLSVSLHAYLVPYLTKRRVSHSEVAIGCLIASPPAAAAAAACPGLPTTLLRT